MAEAADISWIAVNKSGEVSLDSDLPPLPRGWERCLDLQSGIMYLKQMNSQAGAPGHNNEIHAEKGGRRRPSNAHKRQRVLFGDDEAGEGDPALQLTLSLLPTSLQQSIPTSAVSPPHAHTLYASTPLQSGNDAESSLCDANSSIISNGFKFLEMPNSEEVEAAKTITAASSNGSSPSQNASSSSSASSSPLQHKQVGCQSSNMGLGANELVINQEKKVIRAAGCPHCFMYVLPSKSNPKCPRCKSSILVDLSPLTIHS